MVMPKPSKIENEIFFCIKNNLVQFKTCLESVKFPTSQKKFNDVILQAHHNGIVLKSAAASGTIMTRCMIRKEFFQENSYQIKLKNPDDLATAQDPGADTKTVIEFCLPFAELTHIVQGMCEEENAILMQYPCGDNMLQVKIPEESKGSADKVLMETTLQLETYEAQHTLDADYSFKNVGIAAQIFARVHHFKKALKEFSWLENKDVVSMKVSESYPKLQFVFKKASHKRYHAVKFNENMEDVVFKHVSESNVLFTIESLRLAFMRISSD